MRRGPFPLGLPDPPAPAGDYERGLIRGRLGFLSGQFPLRDGRIVHPGRVGAELTEAEGREAAEVAALNAIAGIGALLGGRLDGLGGLLRVDGYVAGAADFTGQAGVLDAASSTFRRLLGERGRHARAAAGVLRLPLDAAVELVVTFEVAGSEDWQELRRT